MDNGKLIITKAVLHDGFYIIEWEFNDIFWNRINNKKIIIDNDIDNIFIAQEGYLEYELRMCFGQHFASSSNTKSGWITFPSKKSKVMIKSNKEDIEKIIKGLQWYKCTY